VLATSRQRSLTGQRCTMGERLFVPDLLVFQARIALGQGRVDDARRWMHELLREAVAQQALTHELRALTMLCELDDVAPEDLHALENACERLREGFDTALVQRAYQLIGKSAAPQLN
jgi:hypothetical protein